MASTVERWRARVAHTHAVNERGGGGGGGAGAATTPAPAGSAAQAKSAAAPASGVLASPYEKIKKDPPLRFG